MADKCQWCGANLSTAAKTVAWWSCRGCGGYTANPRRLSFWGTQVRPESSFATVGKLFARFSPIIASYQFAQDLKSGRSGIDFIVRTRWSVEENGEDDKPPQRVWQEGGLRMRLLVDMPTDRRMQAQRWRLILNWLENTLEAVAIGAVRAEEAFLAFAVGILPDGSEVRLADQIANRLPTGSLIVPSLMSPADRITLPALPAPREPR